MTVPEQTKPLLLKKKSTLPRKKKKLTRLHQKKKSSLPRQKKKLTLSLQKKKSSPPRQKKKLTTLFSKRKSNLLTKPERFSLPPEKKKVGQKKLLLKK